MNNDLSFGAKLDNWRSTPYSKWAFHHVREIVPTADIENKSGLINDLNLDIQSFEDLNLEQVMEETETDATVIAKNNSILFEKYNNGMSEKSPHILFSVSKSILGLIVGALIGNKTLNESDLIIKFVPELKITAYSDATVRDLLDMRVGVKFDEDYTATTGPIINYRYAANWNPVPVGVEAGDLKSFMGSLTERDGIHNDGLWISRITSWG